MYFRSLRLAYPQYVHYICLCVSVHADHAADNLFTTVGVAKGVSRFVHCLFYWYFSTDRALSVEILRCLCVPVTNHLSKSSRQRAPLSNYLPIYSRWRGLFQYCMFFGWSCLIVLLSRLAMDLDATSTRRSSACTGMSMTAHE